ncbi:MAG: tetratricopeptide repeat protein [Terriglobales bacterium]
MPEQIGNLIQDALQARRDSRYEDAKSGLAAAVNLCRKSGARSDLARALTALGQIERDLHHLNEALQHYEEAVAIYRDEGNRPRLAHTVRHLGDIHRSAGHPALAEPCYVEALEIYRSDQQTTPLELANAIRGFAILKAEARDKARATMLWTEARDLYAEAGVTEGVNESNQRLAALG